MHLSEVEGLTYVSPTKAETVPIPENSYSLHVHNARLIRASTSSCSKHSDSIHLQALTVTRSQQSPTMAPSLLPRCPIISVTLPCHATTFTYRGSHLYRLVPNAQRVRDTYVGMTVHLYHLPFDDCWHPMPCLSLGAEPPAWVNMPIPCPHLLALPSLTLVLVVWAVLLLWRFVKLREGFSSWKKVCGGLWRFRVDSVRVQEDETDKEFDRKGSRLKLL